LGGVEMVPQILLADNLGRLQMKLVRLFVLVLVIFVLVVGMGVHAQDPVEMVIGWLQPADAVYTVSTAAFSARVTDFFMKGLFDYDRDFNEYAVMAQEIPSVENGQVEFQSVTGDFLNDGTEMTGDAPIVTLHLRPNMVWSDGTPITADDLIFMDNLAHQPDPQDSWVGRGGDYEVFVDHAEKIDDLTVKYFFRTPYADYVDVLLSPLPSHLFNMDTDGDGVFDANFDDQPFNQAYSPEASIGYGPYVISEVVPGTSISFALNPLWGANEWEHVPAITNIILQVIEDPAQMANALQVGDIDMTWSFAPYQSPYEAMDNVQVAYDPSVFQDALWFNAGSSAFPGMQQKEVREALAAAIDRQAIADQFAAGLASTANWYPDTVRDPNIGSIDYDVDAAREQLTAAGWVDDDADEAADNTNPTPRVSQGVVLPDGTAVPDGTAFVINFYTTPTVPRPEVQIAVQAYWATVGVVARTFVVSGGTVFFASFQQRGILATGEFDVAMFALSNSPTTPNGAPQYFHCAGIPTPDAPAGSNYTRFCNPEYDRLDNLVSITTDEAQRQEYAYQAQQLWTDGAFWYAIRQRPEGLAVRTDRFDFDM
jgi:peptide/nickel transport system substrate-binding protein